MGKKIFTFFRTLYTSKPPQVTVTSSGALHVDPRALLTVPEAQRQIAALESFPVVTNPSAGSTLENRSE